MDRAQAEWFAAHVTPSTHKTYSKQNPRARQSKQACIRLQDFKGYASSIDKCNAFPATKDRHGQT
jgi:hypothetical protein